MDITLSWDLFIIVMFVVIMSYSLIIGRDNTLKVILGTYVAILAADALGSLFGKYFAGSALFVKLLSLASVSNEAQAVIFAKVVIFVAMVIMLSVRGAFEIHTMDDRSSLVKLILTLMYSFMSAALIISAMLTFMSGVAFIGGGNPATTSVALWWINKQSDAIKSIVENAPLFFALPGVSFLFHSIYSSKD